MAINKWHNVDLSIYTYVIYFYTGQFAENETNEVHFKEIPWVFGFGPFVYFCKW